MKLFLLTAGDNHYPEAGEGDWVACYETYQEAKAAVTPIPYEKEPDRVFKYQIIKPDESIFTAHWYEIINLSSWINS